MHPLLPNACRLPPGESLGKLFRQRLRVSVSDDHGRMAVPVGLATEHPHAGLPALAVEESLLDNDVGIETPEHSEMIENMVDFLAQFDLTTGSGSDVGTGTVNALGAIDVGGGIWRCWVTITTNGTSARIYVYPGVIAAGTAGTVFVWGHQLEKGLLTSYIPTAASAVARNADVVGSTTVDWHNADAGTLFARGRFPFTTAAALKMLTVDDNSTADRFYLERDTDDEINFATINSGDNNGASDGGVSIAVDTEFIVAAAYADDDVRAAVDGALSAADSAAGIPVGDTITNLRIGADSGGNYFAGHIAEVRYYNERKLDAYLQDLSNGLVTESFAGIYQNARRRAFRRF